MPLADDSDLVAEVLLAAGFDTADVRRFARRLVALELDLKLDEKASTERVRALNRLVTSFVKLVIEAGARPAEIAAAFEEAERDITWHRYNQTCKLPSMEEAYGFVRPKRFNFEDDDGEGSDRTPGSLQENEGSSIRDDPGDGP